MQAPRGGLVLLILLASSPAWSDENDDAQKRAATITELNGLLADLVGRAGSDVDGALGVNDRIKSKLDELDSVKGDDATAAEMVSSWRQQTAAFPDAANALKQLSTTQDKYKDLDSTCQGQDAAFRAQLKKYVDDKNTNGLTEIPPLADGSLAPIKTTVDEAEAANSALASARERIGGFTADGPWTAVRDKLVQAGEAAWATWDKNRNDYTRSCTPLLKPQEHPAVVETLKFLADLKAARDALIDKLRQQVRGVAQDLAGAPSASDDGVIAGTEGKANQIQSDVAALDPMKGSDPLCNQIVSRWPQTLKDYLNAQSALRQLKQYQHTLDKGPDTCKAAAQQLQDKIAGALQNKADPKGAANSLVADAKTIGAPLADALSKADASKDTVQKARDAAKAFNSDDESWKEVDVALANAADALAQYWQNALGQSHAACDVVAKGENNPDIVNAVAMLTATGQDALKAFVAMADQWIADARACYRVDCDGMKSIWNGFCGDDWEEGDDPDKDGGRSAAKDVGDKMQALIDPVLARFAGVTAAAQVPLNNPDTKDDAQRKYDEVTAQRDKLQKLKDNGSYRGADHPYIQHAIEYGKQQHKSMTSSFNCDVADQPFGDAGRPDCIVFADCEIYEFKPNNSWAKDKGWRQLHDYQEAVTEYYQGLLDQWQDASSPPPAADSNRGGSDALIKLAKCYGDDKKISFGTDVKFYDMCENEYQCPSE
jgi:hypothetical protein